MGAKCRQNDIVAECRQREQATHPLDMTFLCLRPSQTLHTSHSTPPRILAESVPPPVLRQRPLLGARVLEWVRETYIFLRGMGLSNDGFWDVSQVWKGGMFGEVLCFMRVEVCLPTLLLRCGFLKVWDQTLAMSGRFKHPLPTPRWHTAWPAWSDLCLPPCSPSWPRSQPPHPPPGQGQGVGPRVPLCL